MDEERDDSVGDLAELPRALEELRQLERELRQELEQTQR